MRGKSDSLWYPRYVGDYKRKTSHLSMTEHGAYAMLMDHYYSTGKPLPTNVNVLKRVCSAFEDNEVAAMNAVLGEFFFLADAEYHHERADEELLKRSKLSEKRRDAVNSRRDRNGTSVRTIEPTIVPTSTSTSYSESVSYETAEFENLPERTPEQQYFDAVVMVLGDSGRSLGAKLLKQNGGDIRRAAFTIKTASEKHSPREWLCRVLRGEQNETGEQVLAETKAMYKRMGVQ